LLSISHRKKKEKETLKKGKHVIITHIPILKFPLFTPHSEETEKGKEKEEK